MAKEELEEELRKFQLNATGTVDELRKRLVHFLREGREPAPPQPAPQPAIPSTFVTPGPATNQTPLKVHHWGLIFSGREDPAAFLEQLEEVLAADGIIPDRVLPHLPRLLRGEAAMWHRNNRTEWTNWAGFVDAFKAFYFPVNYQEDLEAEISRRTQKPTESVTAYITSLQALMRRHGAIPVGKQLSWLYRNLLPEFRQQMRRTDYKTILEFSDAVRQIEILKREMEATRRRSRQMENAQGYSNAVMTTPPPRVTPSRTPATPVNPPPRFRSSTVQNESEMNDRMCWRCGETGHFRRDCTNPSRLFCSRCRKPGIMSRDCPCPGNANRAA